MERDLFGRQLLASLTFELTEIATSMREQFPNCFLTGAISGLAIATAKFPFEASGELQACFAKEILAIAYDLMGEAHLGQTAIKEMESIQAKMKESINVYIYHTQKPN